MTLICVSSCKGVLIPEHQFNMEIAYKILVNFYPAKSCGTSGIPALLFSYMIKDDNEIL